MAYQPFQFITPQTGVSGNITTTTLFVAPTSAYYVISIYMSPATAIALSTATMAFNFTEGGNARTISLSTLSLGTLNGATTNYLNIRADAGTPIQYSTIAIGIGTYNVHIGYKQQGS